MERPHGGQLGAGPRPGGRAPHPLAAQGEDHVAQDRHVGEHPRVLAEQGHLTASGGHEPLRAVQHPLAQGHPTARGVQQARHHRADRGLARPVGPDEGHGPPGRHGQGDHDVARVQAEGDLQVPAPPLAVRRGGGGVHAGGGRVRGLWRWYLVLGVPVPGSVLTPRAPQCTQSTPTHISGTNDNEGKHNEHHSQGQGGGGVALPLQVDGQRHGAGHALLGAGEGDGGAELPQAAPQGQGGAAGQGRGRQRQGNAHQDPPRARPQGAGGGLGTGVTAAQGRLQGHHQVGHGHEDLRHHHGGGGEGDTHAPGVQPRPQDPLAPQGGQQRDTGHHRGQRHGQDRQDAGDPHPRPAPGQRQGQGHAQEHADGRGGQAGAYRQPQGRLRRRRREQLGQLAPGHAGAQPHQGQHDRAAPAGGQDGDEHGQGRASGPPAPGPPPGTGGPGRGRRLVHDRTSVHHGQGASDVSRCRHPPGAYADLTACWSRWGRTRPRGPWRWALRPGCPRPGCRRGRRSRTWPGPSGRSRR